MIKTLKEWLPEVMASQIAFFILGSCGAFDQLLSGSAPRATEPLEACLLPLGMIGLFLLWGTLVGILEGVLFRIVNACRTGGGRLLRNSIWALGILILVIGPAYPLLESILEQRHALCGWWAYLSVALAGALIAVIALKLLACRCAHPARLLLATVLASALFFTAASGTSLFSLLHYRFRPIQISFYMGIWWASLLSLGLLYFIGALRATAGGGGEMRISRLARTCMLVVCPALAVCLYWLESHMYVGLYGGAHLLIRILAYLLLDLFALSLMLSVKLLSDRRAAARAVFALFAAVIAAAAVIAVRLDLRPATRGDTSLEGSLLLPLLHVKHAAITAIGKHGVTAPVPGEHPVPIARPAARAATPRIPRPESLRVFLIIIDALRADHLSCYGYSRETSPTIDSFSEEAVLFRYCIAPGCRTSESIPTLFTSRDFRHLFLMHGPDYKISSDTSPMLAQVLEQNGFYTLGAGTLFPAYWGYSRGFHDWAPCTDRSLLKKVKEKTSAIKAGKSFCYLHYLGLHGAVDPGYSRTRDPEFREISFGATSVDNYDTTIKLVDRDFNKLLDHLKDEGLYNNSMLIVTADHGAGLGEHGYCGHSRGSFNGEVLVPLLIRAPGFEPKTVSETVGLIDIFPTILDIAGVQGIESLRGRSLVPLMASTGGSAEPRRTYFHIIHRSRTTATKGDYKLIDPGHPRSRLYAFKDDPLEQVNLIDDMPGVADELAEEVNKMDGASVKTEQLPAAPVDPASLRQGLLIKRYDNPRFMGAPVSEAVVSGELLPRWVRDDARMPDEGIYIQWDGYINIPKCPYNKALKFAVQGRSEIEMWMDGLKIMDATGRQRLHNPQYWEGYIPAAPGFHVLRLRLSEKRNPQPELVLLYSPHGKKIPVPPDALFHAREEAVGDTVERRSPQAPACSSLLRLLHSTP
ncbi:MAG: sulfatase-like hydrolase/transferase [Candidatus Tritonobacter lacicola]|nr:sulfatase-like hydrolase/transferase [Candidatus Tritonobacter lacicola]